MEVYPVIGKPVKLTVNLARTNVTIIFLGQARKAIPLCNQYFQGFLHADRKGDAKVEVCILKKPNDRFPFLGKAVNPIFEQLIPTADVAAWLREVPGFTEDFSISEETICSFCLGGLLLFNPRINDGHIYLLNQGPRRFQPLYRLLWMYFAQVLGENGACFVHAVALVRDGEGHLFMGDSGSGKSTLAKHCTGCYVLSDDGPIFLRQNGEYRVYPSPYHQIDPVKGLDKEVIQMSAKVKGLYFLIKDNRVFLERVSKKEAFSMILNRHVHFFPYLSAKAKSALFDLLFEVCYKLPTYYLHFRRDQDVWKVIIGK